MSSTGGSSVPRIQVFRPTMEEFKDFSKYIKYIESTGAHKAGLAKIIPPEGWTPRKKYDNIDDLVIPAPISQVVTGRQGLYQQLNIQQKAMTVKEFRKLAESNKYKTPPHFDYEDLERKYWKNITYNSPIYGADVSGSLYDDGIEEFNIQRLNTILDMVKEDYEIQIEGVNTAYLYFGMWKTSFAWHTEDMDLYSINYLHFGAPKSWYVVPPEHGRRLERLAAGFFHGSHQSCPAFLRHKMTIISPQILKQYSIPYQKITQEPGEFMITFPFGYHSGFNHGYNCAESTNFALPRWIEYGKRSIHCTCRNDCVKICMDMFVRKFQPDIYEQWKAGKDFGTHPEDPSRHYAAPAPKKLELALSAQREERKRVKEMQYGHKIKRHPISKLEKSEKKKDAKKASKVHPRESDEETELYDLNEVITCKTPKKQLRKKRKEVIVENEPDIVENEPDIVENEPNIVENEPNIVENEPDITENEPDITENEPDITENEPESEAQVELETKVESEAVSEQTMEEETEEEEDYQDMIVKTSVKNGHVVEIECHEETEEDINVKIPVDEIKMEVESEEETQDMSLISEAENGKEIVTDAKPKNELADGTEIKNEIGLKTEVLSTMLTTTMDHPPELKPFWAPEVKSKSCVQDNNAANADKNSQVSFAKHMELLSRYPHLKQAISSGTFSVVPIIPSADQKCMSLLSRGTQDHNSMQVEKKCSQTSFPNYKSKDSFSLSSSSSSPNTVFSHTWRCEQTNNGLKIKIVQPKRIQPSIVESISNSASSVENDTVPIPMECSSITDNTPLEVSKESPDQKSKLKKPVEAKERPRRKSKPKKIIREENNELINKNDVSPNGSTLKVQRADHTLDSWAHPIKDLWQDQPKNFEAEIKFNERLACISPHCAICIIFSTMYNKSNFPLEPTNVPSCSHVRMPAYCYGNSLNSECLLDTNSLLRPDGTAPLLICSVCKVCVHATCYGISMLPMGSWVCTRCTKQATEAECCLCVLRGGALKPTTDNRWAHVICAILIAETYFESTLQKQPINVSKITSKRLSLKCKYCVKTVISKGACVQCQSGKCYLPYHVTCGYMAGVIFETSDWPEPLHMICTKHAAARRKPPKRELTNVSVGERVIGKHKNKRYYWANVKRKFIQEYYSILFEDNSHSTNTLPEDIVSRNVAIHGSPKINEKVQVKWTDDKIYNGIFKGSQSCELYVIEFDDGSVLCQERQQIYAADEELPKEIQSKMSHSSERRNQDFMTEAEGKRVRISNHKYS